MIARDVVHHMHYLKGKTGCLLYKIDLKKAYDGVNWEFLRLSLSEFGFPPLIINLIMSCVTFAMLSLLWNGKRLP